MSLTRTVVSHSNNWETEVWIGVTQQDISSNVLLNRSYTPQLNQKFISSPQTVQKAFLDLFLTSMISMKIWRTVIAIDDHLKIWPWLVIWTNLRYNIRDIYHAQPIARRYSSLLCVELLCCVVHQLAILQCQLLALFTLYILCAALVSMGNLKLTQLWLHVQRKRIDYFKLPQAESKFRYTAIYSVCGMSLPLHLQQPIRAWWWSLYF